MIIGLGCEISSWAIGVNYWGGDRAIAIAGVCLGTALAGGLAFLGAALVLSSSQKNQ